MDKGSTMTDLPLPYCTTEELVEELRKRLPLFYLIYGKDEEGDLNYLHYMEELWIDETACIDPGHLLTRAIVFSKEYMDEYGLDEDYTLDD